ncbi:unnamed protein product [Leptidea sinapis]|uniref:Uncharacterized protein n=1 Tax=Leptidea sinapis TaxID=189913 RepID=A0A5E4QZM6_9NEOP|nr:unnamed protein product [Leptidea sinapis]
MVYAECTVIRSPPPEIWRPLAAHCIGYPAMTIGFGIKSQNGIKESSNMSEAVQSGPEARHMNDTLKKRFVKENGLRRRVFDNDRTKMPVQTFTLHTCSKIG